MPGYHKWGRGIISTECLYSDLHAFERHQGTISEAEGLYQLNVCIMFYTHLSDIRAPLNSMIVLFVARIWMKSEYHKWGRGIVSSECLWCVPHELKWHQGTISEPEVLSQLNVCIVFYTHLSDTRGPWVRLKHCLNSMFVLCFTFIWATSGCHKRGRGLVSTQSLYCVLHAMSDIRVP